MYVSMTDMFDVFIIPFEKQADFEILIISNI